jgi:predicted Mrr-cat superfamily restriction endonuclease
MGEIRAWKFRPGSEAAVIKKTLNSGSISLDYGTPGLSIGMNRQELVAKVQLHNADRSLKGIQAHAGQIHALLHKVSKGDIALVPRNKGRAIMIGEIISDHPVISKTSITTKVRWLAPDVPLSSFNQDLQYSFKAILKFCAVSRNGAPGRLLKISQGEPDPGF